MSKRPSCGRTSGPPETLSIATVSPEATDNTGFNPASKNPQ